MKNKNDKILILGNFNYTDPTAINGQTQKTRELYQLLKLEKNFIIDTWDSDSINRNPIKGFAKLFFKLATNRTYIILPAHKSIYVLVPLTLLFSLFRKTRLIYIVIGGWLPDFAERSAIALRCLKRIDSIMVETEHMKTKLLQLNLNNVEMLPNFKLIEPEKIKSDYQTRKPLKGVFISRVTEQKGIFILLDAIKELNNTYQNSINVDFYGPIDASLTDFCEQVENIPNVQYKGVLDPAKIQETFKDYDVLIFPTFYDGEGFPGVFLDAINANLPIVASDWKYNTEIIEHNKTGLVFKAKSVDSLVDSLTEIIESPEVLISIKQNIKVLQDKYYYRNALQIIMNALN